MEGLVRGLNKSAQLQHSKEAQSAVFQDMSDTDYASQFFGGSQQTEREEDYQNKSEALQDKLETVKRQRDAYEEGLDTKLDELDETKTERDIYETGIEGVTEQQQPDTWNESYGKLLQSVGIEGYPDYGVTETLFGY